MTRWGCWLTGGFTSWQLIFLLAGLGIAASDAVATRGGVAAENLVGVALAAIEALSSGALSRATSLNTSAGEQEGGNRSKDLLGEVHLDGDY